MVDCSAGKLLDNAVITRCVDLLSAGHISQDVIFEVFKVLGVLSSGHFILSSGLRSAQYLQCASVFVYPRVGEIICTILANKVRASCADKAFDMVVSPAMGGMLFGYELAKQLDLPHIFCERNKDGVFEIRRGFVIPDGGRVLIAEDVLTTGRSSLEVMHCVAQFSASVVAECVIVDRGGSKSLDVPVISLVDVDIPTYTADNLPEHLASIPAVKPGSKFKQNA